ncbi:MAG: type II toxin-antitoxin system Phd/YefM family antitoxin [Deltaproteobacteria bacterium]|nr:type II toxin-antitoxin system Phd/YefM family antitoxin [Deltaproteobacteria bacterium]
MSGYNLSEARKILPHLIDELLAGRDPVIIERRGKPVAVLTRYQEQNEQIGSHPLRGVSLVVAEDFDTPFDAQWEAIADGCD